jgi:hypothetical protein
VVNNGSGLLGGGCGGGDSGSTVPLSLVWSSLPQCMLATVTTWAAESLTRTVMKRMLGSLKAPQAVLGFGPGDDQETRPASLAAHKWRLLVHLTQRWHSNTNTYCNERLWDPFQSSKHEST